MRQEHQRWREKVLAEAICRPLLDAIAHVMNSNYWKRDVPREILVRPEELADLGTEADIAEGKARTLAMRRDAVIPARAMVMQESDSDEKVAAHKAAHPGFSDDSYWCAVAEHRRTLL